MKLTTLLKSVVLVFLIALSINSSAHTLFLKPDSLYVSPGEGVTVPLINGTFVKSENRIAESRITAAEVVEPDGGISKIEYGQLSNEGDVLTVMRAVFDDEGTYVIGIGTRPMAAHMDADEFNFYLRYEGLSDDMAERRELGEGNVGAAERYAKFAKAVIQVGENITPNFGSVLGHPLEIIPMDNPAELQVGDNFRVRVLKDGEPLIGELLFATHEGHHEVSDEGIVDELVRVRTDDNGEAEFTVSDSGRWYVRLIDLERTGDSEHWYSGILVSLGVEEPKIPYESVWATLTFEVR